MSSEQNKLVIKHQEELVKTFFSLDDERLGMKHFRYTVDDYFNADSSIRPTGSASPVNVDGIYGQWVMAENSDPDKRILYLHGGGYAIGTIRGYLSLASQIAEKTGCSILLIDYSLAPELKFPHGVNDSKKAFLWMLNNGPNGSGKCTKSYISGDSAGGGLSLGVTLALKDDNSDLPNAVIPLSPWAELDPVSETYDTNADIDPYISKDAIAAFRDLYIKDESDLSFPPLIIKTFFEYFFLICFLLFVTSIIFLNSFDFNALSTECSKSALFLYLINCLSLDELNLLLCPEASIIK